jgi:hypothetical protein
MAPSDLGNAAVLLRKLDIEIVLFNPDSNMVYLRFFLIPYLHDQACFSTSPMSSLSSSTYYLGTTALNNVASGGTSLPLSKNSPLSFDLHRRQEA